MHHPKRDAAEHQLLHSTVPVGGDHDQIDSLVPHMLVDDARGIPFPDDRVHHDPL